MVAGYQLQTNLSVSTGIDNSGVWTIGNDGGLTLGGQFNNNPTITYTPVAGADFAALLLQPIAPADVYALIAGGTPPDLVLGLLLGQINGLRDDLIERTGTTASDGRFREFLDLDLALDAAGAFHIRVEGTGKSRSLFLALPRSGAAKEVARPNRAVPGSVGPGCPKRSSRSSTATAAARPTWSPCDPLDLRDPARPRQPDRCAARGCRHWPDLSYVTAEQADLKRVRIRARVGYRPPVLEVAYVTASYRGRWFWIENTDFRSKQVFSFIIQLLQLAQTTNAQSLPIITIPSGLDPWPPPRPAGWAEAVDRPETPQALEALRRSVQRSTPFGVTVRGDAMADQYGLRTTLRPRGRPPRVASGVRIHK